MRNRGLVSQETPQEHMSIVRQRISFQHQAPIRKANMFSTCFYTSFLSRDFPFCTDSLHTCSYSHLSLHTRHLFAEIAYQITQVPREFDTRFLPFYTTCAIWCTCWNRTSFWRRFRGTSFYLGSQFIFRCLFFICYSLIVFVNICS